MPNFVRDGIAIDIPNDSLALLKSCFDKDDAKIESLQMELDTFKQSLKTINIDGDEYKADNAVIKTLEKLKDTAREKETLEAKIEALTAEVEQLRQASSDEIIKAKVADRRNLEAIATQVIGDSNELANMSDRQIKEFIVTQRFDMNLDSVQTKSDEALSAMIEVAASLGAKKESKLNESAELKTSSTVQGDSISKALVEQAEQIANAWQSTLITKEYK